MFGLVQIIGEILSWYFKAIKSFTRSPITSRNKWSECFTRHKIYLHVSVYFDIHFPRALLILSDSCIYMRISFPRLQCVYGLWFFAAWETNSTAYGKSKSWQSDQSANPRITGNIVVNNVQFLAQNDNFASCDLNISSGVMGINFVLPVYAFYALWDSQSDGRRLFAFYEWPKTTV